MNKIGEYAMKAIRLHTEYLEYHFASTILTASE